VDRDAIIQLLVAENPKRAGSAAHERFALLRTGMTVGNYLAAATKHGGASIAAGTLKKALRRGHVRLDPAPAEG
jgi:hypothetical protein